MEKNIKKLILASLFIAIGVTAAHFVYIPVGVAKAYPIQHTINIISAIVLGPLYAVTNAFVISLMRNLFGLGSLLAFPGSIFGALFAGMAYKLTRKKITAVFGEVFGTGIIGGLLSFPIANFLMGSEATAFAFVIPFLLSSATGALIGLMLIKTKIFDNVGGN